MTIINDTRVVRLERTAARTGHQHSGDEPIVETVTNEIVTATDVVSLPPGSLITLQRGPGSGHTEEGSVLNASYTDIGGVQGGQTTSVFFDSEDGGVTAASIFQTEKDFAESLTSPGEYSVNYKTFQVKTYTAVPTTPGLRTLISYTWAPVREFLVFTPEDLEPNLDAFGDGPHQAGGGSVIGIIGEDGYTVKTTEDDGYAGYLFEKIIGGPGINLVLVDDDAYGQQIRIDNALDVTIREHYEQHSEIFNTIIKELDGYDERISVNASDIALNYQKIIGLDTTATEHYHQHSQVIQHILTSLDGYRGVGGTNFIPGCGITLEELDGYIVEVGLDIESLVGEFLRLDYDGYTGCPSLAVDIDAYHVSFDDDFAKLVRGENVQTALESIDGYLQEVKGSVIRLHQLGVNATNYPTNTVYTFDTYEIGAGRLLVFVNGLFQNKPEDYVELSDTTIEFSEPNDDADEIDIIIFTGNFAGGADSKDYTLQSSDDNNGVPKTIYATNGQISFEQTQTSGSALRLYNNNITTALNVIQDGDGPGTTIKNTSATNPTLLLQKDTVARNSISDTLVIERTTSSVLGAQNGIGSTIRTRLESQGSSLFDASEITSIATRAADSIEDVDLIIKLSNDGTMQENLRLTSDGKLGIKTSSPVFTIDVNGDVGPTIDNVHSLGSPSSRWRDGYFGPNSISVASNLSETEIEHTWSFGIDIDNDLRDGYFRLLHNGIERWCVSTDGYVGINTPYPNSTLTVGGSISLEKTEVSNLPSSVGQLYTGIDGNLYYMSPDGNTSDLSGIEPTQSDGDIVLKIDGSTGSDSSLVRPANITSGDYSAYPFETIQAAIDSLPHFTKRSVSITITSGDYAGFEVRSNIINGGTAPGSGQFTITGTTGIATLSSGSTSGTASSGTNRTLTLTGAGWTTNDLRGKYLNITSGIGSGQTLIIKSNTTEVITTVSEMSPAPDATSVFEIIESKTNITSASPSTAGILISNVSGRLDLSNINVSGTTLGISCFSSEHILISNCLMTSNSVGIEYQDMNRCTINQVGIIGATNEAIRIINTNSSNGSDGLLFTDSNNGLRIYGGNTHSISGVSAINTTLKAVKANSARSVSFDILEIDVATTGVEIEKSSLSTVNCSLNSCSTTFNIVHSFYYASGFLVGTGNGGFGVLCNNPDSTVHLADILPTITGTSGDASIDNISVLTWASDFPNAGTGYYNTNTSAKIVRA